MSAVGDQRSRASVAIVGGGLAGMAAAAAAAEAGLHVELFEKRRQLGGRASSFRDRATGRLVDYCQHVALGCCTNLADFCRRVGIGDCFRTERRLHLVAADGTRHDLVPAAWLPAPLHLGWGLMRLRLLSCRQRLGILRALRLLCAESPADSQGQETIGEWLRRHGQSERTMEGFWSLVLQSALGETLERASLEAARKVCLEGLLASRRAYQLEVPQVPLGEMYGRRVVAWLAERDVAVRRGTPVERIEGDGRRASGVVLGDGTQRQFDFIVVAVPWSRVRQLFPPAMLAAMPALEGVQAIRPAPITAVHLWFDRAITPLPHAVLVGRLSQWLFSYGRQELAGQGCRAAYYCQVVVSGSHGLVGRDRGEIVGQVRRDLEAAWPQAREAELLHWRVLTQRAAVFSPAPGIERLRPPQQTPIENLVLAGDWTATGWPATMEGAVRSGYLAVEAVLRSLGEERRLLVSDLPRGVLVRALLGGRIHG
jgi:squalene-associated FAD-dependent desaturase